jgi:CDP-glucose 4,6-dehydratase
VLDPLVAYLMLAQRLVSDGADFAEAWNMGPGAESAAPVGRIADRLVELWGPGARWETDQRTVPPESPWLSLDCHKARTRLAWRPVLSLDQALVWTVDWYKAFRDRADLGAVTLSQIDKMLAVPNSRGTEPVTSADTARRNEAGRRRS